jgi:hypothetical protein
MSAAVVALAVAVALLGILVASMRRAQAGLGRRLDELSGSMPLQGPAAPPRASLVGRPANPPVGVDVAGETFEVRWDRQRRDVVAFLTSGCSTCRPFWDELAGGPPALGGAGLVVVTPDPSTESRRTIAAMAPPGLRVVMSSAAWIAYGVRGAPWFAVVDNGIVVAEGRADTWVELQRLAAR